MASALQTGLLLHAVDLYCAQVVPTPVVYYLTHGARAYDCGVMITASHNPYQDNGIKIIDSNQGKLTAEDELSLSLLYEQADLTTISYERLGTVSFVNDLYEQYKQYLSQHFPIRFLEGQTIVLDCAHGATSFWAPSLFSHFGAHVIPLHNQPNGKNINDACGSLHTQALQKAVLTHGADIGFAFDGDGDRVIAVNRYGQEKNGDALLAVLSEHPAYVDMPAIVGTVMTNQGFLKHLAHKSKALLRAAVGDKQVLTQLLQRNLLLGGEPSGHIIMRDLAVYADGIAVALKVLEAMLITGNVDLLTFEPFPQAFFVLPVQKKQDLLEPRFVAIQEKAEKQLIAGRILVRYSGTENVLRLMAEDETYANAYNIVIYLATEFDAALRTYDYEHQSRNEDETCNVY